MTMVKKIRLVDQPANPKPANTDAGEGGSGELMELLKSMDWKLWELLQIGQRLEKHFTSNDTTKDN